MLSSRDPNTIFRGNSLTSKCIDETMKLAGMHYLHVTLKPTIEEVRRGPQGPRDTGGACERFPQEPTCLCEGQTDTQGKRNVNQQLSLQCQLRSWPHHTPSVCISESSSFSQIKKLLKNTHCSEDRGPEGEGTPSHRCCLSPNSQGLGFSLEAPAAVAAPPRLLVAVHTGKEPYPSFPEDSAFLPGALHGHLGSFIKHRPGAVQGKFTSHSG